MADFSTYGLGSRHSQVLSGSASVSNGVAVAYPATVNTKGSWVELSSSIPFDVCGIQVVLRSWVGSLASQLVDIGLGAASSEVVIISDIPHAEPSPSFARKVASIFLPIQLPKGERLACRCQCDKNTGGSSVDVNVVLFASSPQFIGQPMARATTYGANTANSLATAVASSGTAHTKGSWVQLAASVSYAKGFVLVTSQCPQVVNEWGLVDVAIGAASSEVPILTDYPIRLSGTQTCPYPSLPFLPIEIPDGSRLSVRLQTASGPDTQDMAIIGVA